MPKITKENHPYYRQLANEAIARKKEAKAQALALANSLLSTDLTAQSCGSRLETQLAAIDALILEECTPGKSRTGVADRLQGLIKAQGLLISQLRAVKGEERDKPQERAKRRMLEPLKRLAEQDPGAAMAGMKAALPAHAHPPKPQAEQLTEQAEPGPAVDPASLLE